MRLALNTFIYEVAEVSAIETLKKAVKFGFTYIDLAAYIQANPMKLTKAEKSDIFNLFHDNGLVSSQLLLAKTENIASPDPKLRSSTMDYMKNCAEFQLELGGKQLLICWGCGVTDPSIPYEQSWMYAVQQINEFAQWCSDKNLIIELELDPHVYFVVNNLVKMVKIIEDVNMPNVYPNIDIGHLCITREAPVTLEKCRDKIIHAHISETNTFEHTNSIIGSGEADFRAYVEKILELGIEENCKKIGEIPVFGIEMGEPGQFVEDPDRWVSESLSYLFNLFPEATLKP